MKKLIFCLFALTGTVVLNSCQQDEVVNEAPVGKGATITATMGNSPQSRVFLGETIGTQTDVYWEKGDKFTVEISGTTYTFTISEDYSDETPSATATFTCDEAPTTLPAGNYTFNYNAASTIAKEQAGTMEELSDNYWMQATKNVDEETPWSDVELTFDTKVSIVEITLPANMSATKVSLYNAVDGSLLAKTSTGSFEGKVYFAVAPGTYTGLVVAETSGDSRIFIQNNASGVMVGSKTLAAGNLYRIKKEMTALEDYGTLKMNDGIYYIYGLNGRTYANAFANDAEIKKAVVLEGVTSIGSNAFFGCSNLTSITLPGSVTNIEDNAFANSGLTSITLPAGVTSIGSNLFLDLPSLTNIEVNEASETYKDIDGVLYSKDGTTLICYPAGKETSSVNNLPDGITSIEDYAFYGCSNLTSIVLPNSVTTIGGNAFAGCSSLENITIPASVTQIGNSAFYDCSSLKTINIPDDVTVIGILTFGACSSLENITIPASVTQIGNIAFYKCSSLATVVCKGVTPPTLGIDAFEYCSENLKIYVPASSVESYNSATNWSTYVSKIVEIPEE